MINSTASSSFVVRMHLLAEMGLYEHNAVAASKSRM